MIVVTSDKKEEGYIMLISQRMKTKKSGSLLAGLCLSVSLLVALSQPVQANPEMVVDLVPGSDSSNPRLFFLDDRLNLSAETGGSRRQLYYLDGQGVVVSYPPVYEASVQAGDLFYYSDYDFIWVRDATGATTHLYTIPEDTTSLSWVEDYGIEYMYAENNEVYFVESYDYQERNSSFQSYTLKQLDTVVGGATVINADYDPYPTPEPDPTPVMYPDPSGKSSLSFNGKEYFILSTPETGGELWTVQGTGSTQKMMLVADIKPGVKGSYPGDFKVFRDELYFTANGPDGRELWKINFSGIVVQVANINPKGAAFKFGTNSFYIFNDELYFMAFHKSYGNELWKTDGTEVGTVLVSDAVSGTGGFAALGDSLNVYYLGIEDKAGFYYLLEEEGSHRYSVWVSNGTETGTRLFIQGAVGSSDLYYRYFVRNYQIDTTYFIIYNGNQLGFSLWKTDETKTEAVNLINNAPYISYGAKAIGENLYITVDEGIHGKELWVTNGSVAGTRLISDINNGSDSSNANSLVTMGGALFFAADDGVHGRELWVTDGTTAATRMITDTNSGVSSLTIFGNKVYFVANDGVYGEELWKSDGTVTGTGMIADIYPGSLGSSPRSGGDILQSHC